MDSSSESPSPPPSRYSGSNGDNFTESSDSGSDWTAGDAPRQIPRATTSPQVGSEAASSSSAPPHVENRANGARVRGSSTSESVSSNVSKKDRWIQDLSTNTEAKIRKTTCCSARCFVHVDYNYLVTRSKDVLTLSSSARRTFLRSLLDSDNKFVFNNRKVCHLFLRKAFRLSSEVVTDVANVASKAAPESDEESLAGRTPSSSQPCSKRFSSGSSKDRMLKRDAILSFLRRISEDCGDNMPDNKEIHLPFHQRRELYPLFVAEFSRLYPTLTPASPQYFRRVWKKWYRNVKVRRTTRFTTCERCDEIRRNMKNAVVNGLSTEALKTQRTEHLQFIALERHEYQTKRDRVRIQSSDYLSFIIDGADQSAFGLPHFTTATKSQRGHALKVKLIGLLQHGIPNKLHLFTMTDDHATGANHVIEVIHRFLNSKRSEGPLPRRLFVQMDNCSRENKNKYVMAYFDMLVALGVFEQVEVGFLPVGHTHEDIDQAFSQTSGRLRIHDAITLSDLHEQLRRSFKGPVEVSHLQRVINWSGLCDNGNYIRPIDRITQWRYFNFTRHELCKKAENEVSFRTRCTVKKNCSDEWRDLYSSRTQKKTGGSVLRSCPDLSLTPNLSIKCPEGLDKVSKRFLSEEGRINNIDKLNELHQLRDFIFNDRVDELHWDLQSTIETEHLDMGLEHVEEGSGGSDGALPQQKEIEPVTPVPAQPSTESREVNNATPGSASTAQPIPHTDPSPPNDVAQSIPSSLTRATSKPSTPASKVDYALNSFVVVSHSDKVPSSDAWVAQVLEVKKHPGTNYAHQLKVRWFDTVGDAGNGTRRLKSKFYPCYKRNDSKRRRLATRGTPKRSELQVPWTDYIHTDTVIVSFPGLTKTNFLPLGVQKKLQA